MAFSINDFVGRGASLDSKETNGAHGLTVLAGANLITKSGNITRPANTDPYAIGDEISSSISAPVILSINNAARQNAGTGTIVGAMCLQYGLQATPPSLEVWLFNATHTPDNDNSPFTPSWANLGALVGVIPFSSSHKTADRTVHINNSIVVPFTTGVASTALFARLVTRSAYTPANAEIYSIVLKIWQD
jgi:hypothetical protein